MTKKKAAAVKPIQITIDWLIGNEICRKGLLEILRTFGADPIDLTEANLKKVYKTVNLMWLATRLQELIVDNDDAANAATVFAAQPKLDDHIGRVKEYLAACERAKNVLAKTTPANYTKMADALDIAFTDIIDQWSDNLDTPEDFLSRSDNYVDFLANNEAFEDYFDGSDVHPELNLKLIPIILQIASFLCQADIVDDTETKISELEE